MLLSRQAPEPVSWATRPEGNRMNKNQGMYYTPKEIIDPAAGTGAYLKNAADMLLSNPPYAAQQRLQSDESPDPDDYCPRCGACGEEGCCPASMCDEGEGCLYGDVYHDNS